MIDLEDFVASADRFGPLGPGASRADVVEALGEPDLRDRGRKGRWSLRYGDVDLYLRHDGLTGVYFTLPPEQPVGGGTIEVCGFWPAERRMMSRVAELLHDRGVPWNVDPIMTQLTEEEDSQAWITAGSAHLAFYQGVLQRAGVDFSDRLA